MTRAMPTEHLNAPGVDLNVPPITKRLSRAEVEAGRRGIASARASLAEARARMAEREQARHPQRSVTRFSNAMARLGAVVDITSPWPLGQFESEWVGSPVGYRVTCKDHGRIGTAITTAEFGIVCKDHYDAHHAPRETP